MDCLGILSDYLRRLCVQNWLFQPSDTGCLNISVGKPFYLYIQFDFSIKTELFNSFLVLI